jgi:hypothetical protein
MQLEGLPDYNHELYMALHNARHNPQLPLSFPLPDSVASEFETLLDNYLCAGSPNGKADVFITNVPTDPGLNPAEPGGPRLEDEDEDSLPPEYQRSHRGKPCGHVFKVGEALYWCR